MKYMTRDLVDDHTGRLERDVLIGYVAGPGYTLPRVVACFRQGGIGRPGDYFCLNEAGLSGVIDGNRAHISRGSVLTVSHEQLYRLQREGELSVGNAVVRLIAEE